VSVTKPSVIVAAETSGVVLQLDQVQLAAAKHEQIYLVPAPVAVAELEVRPGPKWWLIG
jgi:hypothetical protein